MFSWPTNLASVSRQALICAISDQIQEGGPGQRGPAATADCRP